MSRLAILLYSASLQALRIASLSHLHSDECLVADEDWFEMRSTASGISFRRSLTEPSSFPASHDMNDEHVKVYLSSSAFQRVNRAILAPFPSSGLIIHGNTETVVTSAESRRSRRYMSLVDTSSPEDCSIGVG